MPGPQPGGWMVKGEGGVVTKAPPPKVCSRVGGHATGKFMALDSWAGGVGGGGERCGAVVVVVVVFPSSAVALTFATPKGDIANYCRGFISSFALTSSLLVSSSRIKWNTSLQNRPRCLDAIG